MFFCQYSELLGKPNQGFHAQRLGPFALYDLLGTIFLGFVLSRFTKKFSILTGTLFMFVLGQVLHWLFCVDTAFLRLFKN